MSKENNITQTGVNMSEGSRVEGGIHIDNINNNVYNNNAIPREQLIASLENKIASYKRTYILFGDPCSTNENVEHDIGLLGQYSEVNKSIAYAKLLTLSGNLLINCQEDSAMVEKARIILEQSLGILELKSCLSTPEGFRARIQAEYLRAVTYRQCGYLKIAYNLTDKAITILDSNKRFEPIELLSLHKLIAVIEGQEGKTRAFDRVKTQVISNHNLDEQFYLRLRMFEYNLNMENMDECDRLHQELNELSKKVKETVHQVYFCTYSKLLYHFYYLKKDKERSNFYYKKALKLCKRRNLHGQIGGLDKIKLRLTGK